MIPDSTRRLAAARCTAYEHAMIATSVARALDERARATRGAPVERARLLRLARAEVRRARNLRTVCRRAKDVFTAEGVAIVVRECVTRAALYRALAREAGMRYAGAARDEARTEEKTERSFRAAGPPDEVLSWFDAWARKDEE